MTSDSLASTCRTHSKGKPGDPSSARTAKDQSSVDIDENTLYRWLTAGETQVRGQFCEFRKEFMRALADSAESLRLG